MDAKHGIGTAGRPRLLDASHGMSWMAFERMDAESSNREGWQDTEGWQEGGTNVFGFKAAQMDLWQ